LALTLTLNRIAFPADWLSWVALAYNATWSAGAVLIVAGIVRAFIGDEE